MTALALLVLAVSPAGSFRFEDHVVTVTATETPKKFLVGWTFDEKHPAAAAQWDEKSRRLAWEEGGFVLSADGQTLIAGKSSYVRMSQPEIDALPAEKARRKLQSEGKTLLKFLFVAEKSFYAEKDTYSADFAEIGFVPERCSTPVAVAAKGEAAGCLYTVKVVLKGKGAEGHFLGTATGAGEAKGIVLTISSEARGDDAPGMIRVEK